MNIFRYECKIKKKSEKPIFNQIINFSIIFTGQFTKQTQRLYLIEDMVSDASGNPSLLTVTNISPPVCNERTTNRQ